MSLIVMTMRCMATSSNANNISVIGGSLTTCSRATANDHKKCRFPNCSADARESISSSPYINCRRLEYLCDRPPCFYSLHCHSPTGTPLNTRLVAGKLGNPKVRHYQTREDRPLRGPLEQSGVNSGAQRPGICFVLPV